MDSRSELLGYVAAVVVLVLGGALLRTAVLNWVAGPVIVVACVMVATRLGRGSGRS